MAEGDSVQTTNVSLQSNDTRDFLDVVDNLRSHGISRYIDLPQIIVCGEQSAGKSSVLEAISGVKFPSKDNLCTRFATELILRRGPIAPIKIRIVPGPQEHRSEEELKKLNEFHVSVPTEDVQLGDVIESAKNVMGISDDGKAFSSDILRLELSGPEQPHLTLVDLPGLFTAGSRSQSEADSEIVKSLVLSYMKSPRSIILAVVSAKSEFNNQSITKYSRKFDPNGTRTLGLITKPDKLDEGSDMERFYVELAQNKDVKFRLGWHVLRNRDYASRDSSAQDRNNVEAQFFASGVWRSFSRSQVGVDSLKPRLSNILKDHILDQLPDVLTQIQDGIEQCTIILDSLGASRDTPQEQRQYLGHVSQSFSTLISAAINGQYSDPFFGQASTSAGYQRRLRAILQNTLTDFAKLMRQKGHTYTILDVKSVDGDTNISPRGISRSDYIAKVKSLLERSRGRELPGTFDPLIIGELFQEQSQPWGKLVNQYVDTVLRAVNAVVRDILSHVCDRATLDRVWRRIISAGLDDIAEKLRNKVSELLRPHDTGHPITYNHYLTENVQKAQSERQAREIRATLNKAFGKYDANEDGNLHINVAGWVDMLTRSLTSRTEADMNNYASSTATDFMEAYYKVALKRIVDDFSVLGVEACLIQDLPSLFSPASVIGFDDSTVLALASEGEDSATERGLTQEKLKVLEVGLRALKDVQQYSSSSRDPSIDQNPVSENTESESEFHDETASKGFDSGYQTPPKECPGAELTCEDNVPIMVPVAPTSDEWGSLPMSLSSAVKKKKKAKRSAPVVEEAVPPREYVNADDFKY